jgi:transposase-like protein
VYVCADGLYVKAGLEDSKAALLLMISARTTGHKVVLAVASGQVDSQEPWGGVSRGLCAHGLKPWRCMMADGRLGIWVALAEQQPTATEQQGWSHRIAKVLAATPKKHHVQARTLLCAMPDAESPVACQALRCGSRSVTAD